VLWFSTKQTRFHNNKLESLRKKRKIRKKTNQSQNQIQNKNRQNNRSQ
jgi:hypothetical protein